MFRLLQGVTHKIELPIIFSVFARLLSYITYLCSSVVIRRQVSVKNSSNINVLKGLRVKERSIVAKKIQNVTLFKMMIYTKLEEYKIERVNRRQYPGIACSYSANDLLKAVLGFGLKPLHNGCIKL
jgi:uncharacterized membrane protein